MLGPEVLTIVFLTYLLVAELTLSFTWIEIRDGMCFYPIVRNVKISRFVQRMFRLQVARPMILTHNFPANWAFHVLMVVLHFGAESKIYENN